MPDPNETAQALFNGLPPNPDINEALAPNDAIAKALMEYGQRQAQGVANLAMTPGDVAQGKISPQDASDWGPAMAMALMGRGMPAAETGAAGIFGGRLAKTADLPALYKAQASEIKGATPTDIWHDTGWYQGPDQKWRFEIPDEEPSGEPVKAFGPGSIFPGGKAPTSVGQIMQHPALYEAYPDLKNMPILWDQPSTQAYHNPGFASLGAEHIALSPNDPSRLLTPVALHELQHAVQWREGFPRGANYYGMQSYAKQAAKRMGIPLEEPIVRQAGEQAYLRHAGETESRNVSNRYNAPWAYNAPPWQTEDIPQAQQIVRSPFPNSPYASRLLIEALKGK